MSIAAVILYVLQYSYNLVDSMFVAKSTSRRWLQFRCLSRLQL